MDVIKKHMLELQVSLTNNEIHEAIRKYIESKFPDYKNTDDTKFEFSAPFYSSALCKLEQNMED